MPRFYENHTLSHREWQVIDLAGKGSTDQEIAKTLGISESTVTTYWDRIRLKYGAHHRTELVLRVQQEKFKAVLEDMRAENKRLLDRVKQMSGPMLQEIVDAIDEALIVIDDHETIRFVNKAAATVFGYEVSELAGALHGILVPEELREVHEAGVRVFLDAPSHHEMGDHVLTWARHRSGQIFQIHAILTPVHTSNGLLVMCAIRDGSDPREYFDSVPCTKKISTAA